MFKARNTLTALLVAAALASLSIGICVWIRAIQTAHVTSVVETNMRLFSVKLEARLREKFAIAEVLREQLAQSQIPPERRFARTAAATYDQMAELQALNWVSAEGRITVIMPTEGNEPALGLDLTQLSVPAETMARARTSGKVALTPPLTLAQGGAGIVAYVPVLRAGELLGYLNLVFRTDPLIQSVIGPQQAEAFVIALDDDGTQLFGNMAQVAEAPFMLTDTLNIGGRTWQLAIAPAPATIASVLTLLDEGILAAGLTLAAIVSLLVYTAGRGQEAVRSREERFSLAMQGASDGLYDRDLITGEVYLSPRWFRMLGYSPETYPHTIETVRSLIHPDDRPWVFQSLEKAQAEGQPKIEIEFRMKHRDDSWRTVLARAFVVYKDGIATRIVGTHIDITEDRNREQALEAAAMTDHLTGLRNRRGLAEELEELARNLTHGERLAILHVDLDQFKQVNDAEGHLAGDLALTHTADQLRSLSDDFVLMARVGGDEFLLALRTDGPDDALRYAADKIIDAVNEPFSYRGKSVRLSACVGISILSQDTDCDLELAMANADIALIHAKARGSSGAAFFEPNMRLDAVRRADMQADIQRGLRESEFLAYFQPQVDLRSREIVGFEALVRWRHPEKGIISAGHFIDCVNDTRVLREIDAQVLAHACNALKQIDRLVDNAPSMSLNLSTEQLREPGAATYIQAQVQEHGIPANRICLEILETTLLSERAPLVRTNVNELADEGFVIELDDFGTGHTAIWSLLNFPISRIKIDRSLIRDVNTNTRLQAVMRALVALGADLNIEILGEGIETQAEADYLTSIGCVLGQGYHIGRPMAAEQLVDWIAEWRAMTKDARNRRPA